jgi:hypothetical protein
MRAAARLITVARLSGVGDDVTLIVVASRMPNKGGKLKRGTPRSPKLLHLAKLLKVKIPTAVGYLELLWHFTAEFAPQGDIGKYDDRWIEAALFWTGRQGFLIHCLTVAGWLDDHSERRLVIHDWHDHADDAVRKRLIRSGQQFLTHRDKVTGQNTVTDRTLSPTLPDNGILPEPCLARALPEPTPSVRAVAPILKSLLNISLRASDLNGQSSLRFDEFWQQYPRKQHRDAACQEWLSVVTVESEPQVFACLSRYLASDEVTRGAVTNPEKWLMEQHRDGWAGDWPKFAPRAPEQRETALQSAIRKAKEEKNGTR